MISNIIFACGNSLPWFSIHVFLRIYSQLLTVMCIWLCIHWISVRDFLSVSSDTGHFLFSTSYITVLQKMWTAFFLYSLFYAVKSRTEKQRRKRKRLKRESLRNPIITKRNILYIVVSLCRTVKQHTSHHVGRWLEIRIPRHTHHTIGTIQTTFHRLRWRSCAHGTGWIRHASIVRPERWKDLPDAAEKWWRLATHFPQMW